MAALNPSVPEQQAPNFLGYSRPIQNLAGNQAGETLGKTIGTGIDEAANIGNKAVESQLSDDVNRGIDTIRSGYINKLQNVYQDLTGKQYDTVPGQPDNTPPQQLQDRINNNNETLEAARASGRYSNTHIDMLYDDYLKDMRSKYPGYRQFIDEAASKSMGYMMPANKVVQQLTGDINSYAVQQMRQRSNVDAQVATKAQDGNPEAIALGKNPNATPEEKAAFVVRDNSNQATVANLKSVRDTSWDQGSRTAAAVSEANTRVNVGLQSFIHTFTAGNVTPAQLIDDIQNPKVNAEQRQQETQQLDQYLSVFKQKQMADFAKLDGQSGRSLSMDLGGKGEDIVDKQMAMARSMSQWIKDGQGGPVASTVQYVKAMNAQPVQGMLRSSVNQYVAMHNKLLNDNPNGNDYLVGVSKQSSNLPPSLASAVDSRRIALASGTDYQGNNNPMPINSVIRDAKQTINGESIGDASSRNFYGRVVNFYQDLFDKSNPQVQRNVATSMFGPGNEGVMNHFPVDTTHNQGQATVFNRWFSPATDQEMFGHIGKRDSALTASYAALKKNEFTNTVFPNQLADLQGYENTGKTAWSYDNVSHQIGMHTEEPSLAAQRSVDRMNVTLASMKSMAKHTGEDANGLVLHALMSNQSNSPILASIQKAAQSSYHQAHEIKEKTEA